MDKYLKRKAPMVPVDVDQPSLNQKQKEIDLEDILADPGLRKPINEYLVNDRDRVRRAYLQKGPTQPHGHMFPQKMISGMLRRFNEAWFDEYPSWLEYSVEKDSVYCLYCYLFKSKSGYQGGGDSFVGDGFSNWKKKGRFDVHVGRPNSSHNEARMKCENLMNKKKVLHLSSLSSH
ncbi:zinc finger MYM-type protein 5-like [Tripterygium wilfordii]|uniref:zinc finger MYM-type protein 5-like n=1 Tax=Tripterygium wilfordii TaxID=458696 RepID=UPI0018F85D0C|nr:zinc finger MYM-type protein 5-like [Tripterygium wilfordii]